MKADPDYQVAAQAAYEAYCQQTEWKSAVTGAPLPQWADVRATVKAGWYAAAEAAILSGTQFIPEHLSFSVYEQRALGTVSPVTPVTKNTISVNGHILRGVYRLIQELSHDIDLMKKSIFYGKPLTESDLQLIELYESKRESSDELPTYTDDQTDLLHAIFGLIGEGGELLESLLDPALMEVPYSKGGVVEESGDATWYLPLALRAVKSSLAEAAHLNNLKLAKRYASGAFSQGEALTRDTDAEIAAMQPPISPPQVGKCCE